jgi:hypothetical protein
VSTYRRLSLHHNSAFYVVLCLILPTLDVLDDVTTTKDKVHIEKDLFAARIALVTAMLLASMVASGLESLAWLEAVYI